MHCCDLSHCMSSIKSPIRLVAVCQKEQVSLFDKRQIPINIDEHLIVKFFFDLIKKKDLLIFFRLIR